MFPPLVLVGLVTNLISIVLATAMLFVVLWQSRSIKNLIFAVFLLSLILQSFSFVAMRLGVFFDYSPTVPFYILFTAIGISGYMMFVFVTYFTGGDSPLIRALYGGFAITLGLAIYFIWNGQFALNLDIDKATGLEMFEYSPIAYGHICVFLLCECVIVGYLLVKRPKHSQSLLLPVLFMLVAAILDLFKYFSELPSYDILTSFSSVLFTQAIFKEQYLDPQVELNRQLAASNRELEDANRSEIELNRKLVDANENLERASKLREQFLASVSHELRTPLNAILVLNGVLLTEKPGQLNDKQRLFLNQIYTSSKHLLSLINDVLDISKMQSGNFDLIVSEVNLSQVIEEVALTTRALVKDGVEFVVLSEDHLPTLMGDARRVKQIILNLLSNACKFTEQGEVRLAVQAENGIVRIIVSDTGSGIEEENNESIFEAFKQAKAGRKHLSGTGLGLPIAKRLVEAHAGRIWFESRTGQINTQCGSTFYVELPIGH